MSGLEDAACHAPRACMEICRSEPVRLPTLDRAAVPLMVLPTRSLDRLPLRSLAPSHIRRQPDDTGLCGRHRRIPVIFVPCQHRPKLPGHLVGQCNPDQHFRLLRQHAAEPALRRTFVPGVRQYARHRSDDQKSTDVGLAGLRNPSKALLLWLPPVMQETFDPAGM